MPGRRRKHDPRVPQRCGHGRSGIAGLAREYGVGLEPGRPGDNRGHRSASGHSKAGDSSSRHDITRAGEPGFVYRRNDDSMINELIIASGYARPLTIAPNDAHRERFVAAANAAETAGLGLWSACR
jgi:Staphylococcal nuclease homologue